MAYTKTNWSDDVPPPLDEDNMNKIEDGIFDNDASIVAHKANDGSDHSFIDQDVTTTADVIFQSIIVNQTGTNEGIRVNMPDSGAENGLTVANVSENTFSSLMRGAERTNGTNWLYRNVSSTVTTAPLMLMQINHAGDDQAVLVLSQAGTGNYLEAGDFKVLKNGNVEVGGTVIAPKYNTPIDTDYKEYKLTRTATDTNDYSYSRYIATDGGVFDYYNVGGTGINLMEYLATGGFSYRDYSISGTEADQKVLSYNALGSGFLFKDEVEVQGDISVTGTVDGIDVNASVTANNNFRITPSTIITAGTNLSWSGNTLNATGGSAPEGTSVLSTGETGAVKYLREDGDGTCSWQVPAGSGDVSKVGIPVDNQIGVWTGDGTIEGTTGLTYNGTTFNITGNITLSGTVDGIDIATDVAANNSHRVNTSNPHNVLATQISDFDTEVSNNTDVGLNTTHRTSNGTDHTYINQDVTTTGTPTHPGMKFTPTTAPTYQEGQVWYDSVKNALTVYNNEADIQVNLGYEHLIPVYNNSGYQIDNGKVVYPSGTFGTATTIDLADASRKDECQLIAVATHDIPTGTYGYVTRLGEVGGVNTTGLSGIVYLKTDGSGDLTMSKPDDGGYVITVGTIAETGASGKLNVDPHTSAITVEVTDTNGFPADQRTNTSLTFSDVSEALTITASSYPFHYYILGDKYEVETSDSVTLDGTEGLHAIYYDGSTLTAVANPNAGQIDSVIRTKAIVAYVYWDATNSKHYALMDERHGIGMAPDTHAYLHFTRGAQYLSGLAPSDVIADGSTGNDSSAQFGITSGLIADEDLITQSATITSTTGLPIYYLEGATGELRRVVQSGFSCYNTGSVSGRIFYNEWTGATWKLTEIGSNNDFCCYHIFAVNGYTDKVISVMGQSEYTTRNLARAGVQTEISNLLIQLPFEEVVPLASFIFKTNSGYGNTINAIVQSASTTEDYVDWRVTELAQGAAPSDHNNLTNLNLANTGINWGHIDDQAQSIYGVKTFNALPQSAATPTASADLITKAYGDANYIGAGGVTSFNSRTGAVVPVSGDYEASEVTNAFDKTADDTDDITEGTAKFTTAGDISKLSGIETGAEVNNISDANVTDLTDGSDSTLHYHATDRNRSNHTGTQAASTISDFDTEVSNNSSVVANTAKVGVTDEISNISEDTTPQLGGNLDLNGKGITLELTAGESLVSGDLCYYKSDGKMWKADRDAEATIKGLMCIALETISADVTGTFLKEGNYTTTGLTVGAEQYVSSTAGDWTGTKPTTSGDLIRVIGFAINATTLYFSPDNLYIEVA